jgi:hypothetical protein
VLEADEAAGIEELHAWAAGLDTLLGSDDRPAR